MEQLNILRKKIDGIDNEILQLINERMRLNELIYQFKMENNLPLEDKERANKVKTRLMKKEKSEGLVETI